MQSIAVTLEQPLSRYVDQRSREQNITPHQTIMKLLDLGFETFLRQRYDSYRRGEISNGRFAEELGITTWELSHLLDDRGWTAYNLPDPV